MTDAAARVPTAATGRIWDVPTMSTLARRQLRFVLAWAELHQEELLENWRLARAGETLREIEPLR